MRKNYLYNKTVVVSGASGGLGFAISKLLIEKYNCKIIGIARNEEKIKKAIESLGDKKGNFTYKLFDVSVKENWYNFAQELTENGTKIDVLINNAGFMHAFKRFEDLPKEEVQEIIDTNFLSVVNATTALLPILKQSSTPAIVNIASIVGHCVIIGLSMYSTTKFAVRGFTESLQQEFKKKNFYIGGVYPGFIRTNILNRMNLTEKNGKMVAKLMMPVEKAAKKIVKGMAKRKKRMILGFDGKYMYYSGKLFPNATPAIIRGVLKKSKLDMFDDLFGFSKDGKKTR